MNKFIKFPLVLGLVGIICGAALGVVNEITAPIIEQKTYEKVNAAFKDICSDFDKAVKVETFDADQLKAAGIASAYSLEKSDDTKVAYAYQVSFSGYAATVTYLAAISPTETKFVGFKIIDENETKKGTLQSDDLPSKFNGLEFANIETGIVAEISGASKSVQYLKESLTKLAEFHNVNVLGGEVKTIDLTDAEINKLGLAAGETLLDKSEDYFTALGTKAQKAKDAGIVNYFNIMNGETKTGFGFVSKVEEFSIPEVGKHTYKIVVMFDNNGSNSKLVVVRTDDTMTTKDSEHPEDNKLNNFNYLNGDDYEATATSIADHSFINLFNGKTYTELNASIANANPFDIDTIEGATFTSTQIRKMVVGIISYYKNI